MSAFLSLTRRHCLGAPSVFSLGALVIAAALFWSEPVFAQTESQDQTQGTQPAQESLPPAQIFGDWQLRCRPNADGATETCILIQNLINPENQEPLMQVAVGVWPPNNDAGVVVTLPLGVVLPPGIQVKIDNQAVGAVPFFQCGLNGCQAHLLLDDKLLGSMKAGLQGMVLYRNQVNQPVQIPFSLKGFTAGQAAVK